MLQALLAKLAKRLLDWSERYMPMASKEILVKAAVQAIPTYVMRVSKIPFSVCDEFSKHIRQYWWEWRKEREKWRG